MNINLSPKAILNNEKFGKIAETTATAVAIETVLKSIGRPAFIYMDKDTNAETKKYSATKEFLYQALCLGIYLSIIPQFKKGGFAVAKKIFADDDVIRHICEKGKTYCETSSGRKGLDKIKTEYKILSKNYKEFMNDYHHKQDNCIEISQSEKNVKGSVEAVSIIGSILGLTILAPQISHVILHPIMNAIGMGKKHDRHAEKPKQPEAQTTGVNVQA
jgi:hypothetical protein